MKKMFAIILALCLLSMLAMGVCATENDDGILYEYDPETAAQEWGHFTGNWTYDENGISVTNDGNDVWFYTYLGVDQGWTDYIIEVDLINVAEGGVIFRSTNPGPGVDAFGGYIIAYDSAYAFVGMDDKDCWKTLPDDGPDAPAASALGYSYEQHWKIVVEGNKFTLYINDSPIPFVQVVDSTYTEGGIGLRCKVFTGDDSGYFQNLKVYEIPEEPEVTEPEETEAPTTEPEQTEPVETKKPVPAATTPAPTEQTEPADVTGGNWVWIAVAAAVVVVAVVVIVVAKKKKA